MGFTFQIADRTLSKILNVDQFELSKLKRTPEEIEAEAAMKSGNGNVHEQYETREKDMSYAARFASKMVLAPLMATSFESLVSNKAEGVRFYGPDKFAKIEGKCIFIAKEESECNSRIYGKSTL